MPYLSSECGQYLHFYSIYHFNMLYCICWIVSHSISSKSSSQVQGCDLHSECVDLSEICHTGYESLGGVISGVHGILLHCSAHDFMNEMSGAEEKLFWSFLSSNLLHLLKFWGQELEGSRGK